MPKGILESFDQEMSSLLFLNAPPAAVEINEAQWHGPSWIPNCQRFEMYFC